MDTPWMEYFAVAAQMRAVDLIPLAADWKPDLVVHEETGLAGPVVAAYTGARLVVHGLGLMPPLRIWEAFAPAIDRLLRQWDTPTGARRSGTRPTWTGDLPALAAAVGGAGVAPDADAAAGRWRAGSR